MLRSRILHEVFPTAKSIKPSARLKAALDKLQQQIDAGKEIREEGVFNYRDLDELRAERRVWAEYTAEVLSSLFPDDAYAHDFASETTPYDRGSGALVEFERDEKKAVLSGIAFLRSLHSRLPLIVGRTRMAPQAAKPADLENDPQAEATGKLLERVHAELGNRYRQSLRDLDDVTRLSYRGTANELREILREVLGRLAPDEVVIKQPWFTPAKDERGNEQKRPTHQQRARYILEKKNANSSVRDVAERSLGVVEDALSKLAREMYTRTSTASHTAQDRQEIKKQVMYLNALIHDLCAEGAPETIV